jgi:diaminopimelate decarboxylase
MNAQEGSLAREFESRDGELCVAGRKISEIAAAHPTPFYLYDLARLRARHDELRAALPKEVALTYAVKANPNQELVRLLGGLYDGVDLASGGEMATALAAGVPAARMSFAGPGKSLEEIRYAVSRGIGTISLESERELDHLEAICAETGREAKVLVRVNPDFEFARSGLKMGGGSKQFGVDSERVPALLERLAASPKVRYHGIHIFSGTQNLNADSVLEAFAKILDYAARLERETGRVAAVANLGGGLGIPYFQGDKPIDLARVGAGLRELIAEYGPKLPGTRFKLELGRYLVGECGWYVTRVRYRKVSRGAVFLILDGGMHHHLAASGNISQSPIRRQMRILAATRLEGPAEKVNLAGPLCTPLDTFGLNVSLPAMDEGDLLAIPNSGAYGPSMSPTAFLSHPPPGEVLL